MTNSKKLRTWLDKFNSEQPLLIAGPCSAETEDQLLSVAHELKSSVSILRAGIWKPRTRPGNFEGVGAIGLKWLQKAKQETGLLTATEVANPQHVKLALEHDVDVLWIGARTTVSPFMVQELAEILEGTDKIILIKNPVNPDLALWLGAVERFYAKNVKNLGVIHRGFSSHNQSKYRNNPEWQIPIELANNFPDLPLICDPSHIAGRRDLIDTISQTALNLHYDGLMIETHCSPDEAWSDAKQQITPKKLLNIVNHLKVRPTTNPANEFKTNLSKLRAKIDVFDRDLINVLGRRMKIVEEIGLLKNKWDVSILQNSRWNEILQNVIEEGKHNNLSEDFIITLFKAIHQESIDHQGDILG